jgi:hypothetical protein
VTTTDIQQDTFVGIRAVYGDSRYEVGLLGKYFTSLSAAWDACTELAAMRSPHVVTSEAINQLRATSAYAGALEDLREYAEQLEKKLKSTVTQRKRRDLWHRLEVVRAELLRLRLLTSPERTSVTELQPLEKLEIFHLRIESPMEVTLAVVQGGGVMAAVAYSVHLLVHVMRDPERVGGWLPRVVAGWHKGMTDVEQARQDHAEAETERKRRRAVDNPSERLIAAAENLKELPADEATAIGAGETPDDIVAALSE